MVEVIEKSDTKDLSPWEAWIVNQKVRFSIGPNYSSYDKLIDLAISQYKLNRRNQHREVCDKIHYLVDWWHRNSFFMKKYKSQGEIGIALGGRKSCSINHYINKRKRSNEFDSNTACIKDFLES